MFDEEARKMNRPLTDEEKHMGVDEFRNKWYSDHNKRESENNRIRASARDSIVCSIIGMQNHLGEWNSERYKAWQEVIDMITERYGGMFKPFID